MWIGDVGQGSYEEIDRAVHTSTGSGRGYNWGWRVMEGRHCHIPSSGCNTSGKMLPIIEYTQASNGRCAVTGGYVYRGSRIPALDGYYVFGDYCSGEIWAIRAGSSYPPDADHARRRGQRAHISSFGESATGELFVSTSRHDLGHRTRRLTRRRGFPRAPRLARMPVMTGYVAMARVERGRVRALAWDESASAEPAPQWPHAGTIPAAVASLEPDEAITIGEQWDRLRDQLSMVTFYLTDPESWR